MKKLSHGCTLDCFDSCKFNVHVTNNTVTKIEGDPLHPYTKGFICKKGLAHLERLNHPNRLLKPLLKVDDSWQEISFEKALALMAEKLLHYKNTFGSQSVLYYEQYGNGGLLKSIGDLFFNFYGGATKQKGGPCWSGGIAAQKADFGDSRSHALEDMLNSKAIFVWGKNPASTTIHTMQMLRKAKKQGIPIIVIDPIYTETAKLADLYIPIKPNGDYALALAMGKSIIEKGLYDADYIARFVSGFASYKAYVQSLDLDQLLKACGLTKDTLNVLVDTYTQKYATILLGYGLQKYYNGGATIRLIDALGALTGQIGFSGGGINYANKVYPKLLNTDPFHSDAYAENRYVSTSKLGPFILESLLGNEVPLKMAVIAKSNLLNQLPSSNALQTAFSQIEFKVCFEQFMTDTATACDLVIPATTSLESEDLLFSSMANPYLTYNEQAAVPADPLMDEYAFFAALAAQMRLTAYPQISKTDYLNQVLAPLKTIEPQMSLDYLKDNYFTCHENIAWENQIFDTPSGKFEMHTPSCYVAPQANDALRLLTTHSKETLFSQHIMDETGIAKAYINQKTAAGYALSDNELVLMRSPNGSIKVHLIIDDAIAERVVMMHVGWWHKHGNPNTLTCSEESDMGGQIVYHETFVTLHPLTN